MQIWITKYALTTGIFVTEAEDDFDSLVGDAINVIQKGACNGHQLYFRGNWHTTEEKAIAKAEKMKKLKIISLKKQIKKLQKLEF